MREYHIDSGPTRRGFVTREEVAAAARARQARQRAFRRALSGSVLSEVHWSMNECIFGYANGQSLEVTAKEFKLHWNVVASESAPRLVTQPPIHVAEPDGGSTVFDPRVLRRALVGGEFRWIFADDLGGLLLYTQDRPVLRFTACRIAELEEDLLFGALED